MSDSIIQYAFVAGELSPTLAARSDLEKYDLGLSLCYNFFVDYRGGISTRPGTRFVDYLQGAAVRLFKFAFSPDTEDTYLVIVGDGWVRFVQSGGFVVEAAVTVTGVAAGVATATAHGYSTDDLVYLGGKLFFVGATTANTFELLTPWGELSTASPGPATRVYTVAAPWALADLQRLVVSQRRDEMIFTHPSYPPYALVRAGATSWTLAAENFTTRAAAPTGLTLVPSSGGAAGAVFAVTAVVAGEESAPTRVLIENSVDYTSTAGYMRITWNAQAADYYNVYRSIFLTAGLEVTYAQELGYIGRAVGPVFIDNNIIPDFSRTPPDFENPFAAGGIASITVTAPGTAYDKANTVTVSGSPGTGFAGYPIINDGGNIVAVVVTSPGSGYVNPTVSFVTGTGSGATATATVTPSSGLNPATNRIFQQRRVYGGSDNEPMTLWGSKIADYDNFDKSPTLNADDSYEFTLDAELVAPIRHLVPMQGGLVVMSQGGVWQLKGAEGAAVSPINALADPQSYNGCSYVPPITIDTDILYTQEKGAIVRSLAYNDLSKVFAGTDISTLSNHFFKRGGEIVRWSYAEEPFKLVWAARANGGLLSFTYVREQEVYAWAQHWTQGQVLDILTLEEDNRDYTYLVVRRFLNGHWLLVLERFEQRDFPHVDAYWGVDCGLQTTRTYPDAVLTPAAISGTTTVSASAAVFTSGDVGKVIRAGSAKAIVTGFTATTVLAVSIVRPFEALADTTIPVQHASGAWTLDPMVSTLTGLDHLEGQTVSILADGNVEPSQVVEDGAIILSNPASVVTVGLPFTCKARTLPLTASSALIEGKLKRVVGVLARVHETRGLAFGRDETSLYELKDRTNENYGEPIEPQSTVKSILIEPKFEPDGSIFIQQSYPLPGTVLGLVLEADLGDEDA